MEESERSSSVGISAGFVASIAFGLLLIVLAVIPATRPIVFVLLWVFGPTVAYGTLLQVFRGRIGLQSAAGIVFALVCGFLAFVSIPVGLVVVDETLTRSLQFFGLGASIVAIAASRLSTDTDPTPTDRSLPPLDTE